MSSSRSASSSDTLTTDKRISAGDRSMVVSVDGGEVSIQNTSDEAFAFAEAGLELVDNTVKTALAEVTRAHEVSRNFEQTEEAQLSAQLIKIGIPAAMIAYAVSRLT